MYCDRRSECNLVVNKNAGLIVVLMTPSDVGKKDDDDEAGSPLSFFDIGICLSRGTPCQQKLQRRYLRPER